MKSRAFMPKGGCVHPAAAPVGFDCQYLGFAITESTLLQRPVEGPFFVLHV